MESFKIRCLILKLDLLLLLHCWAHRAVASPVGAPLWALYLNLRTWARLQKRHVLRSCLGCGAGARLPGRTVCNKCSVGAWQKFGHRTVR